MTLNVREGYFKTRDGGIARISFREDGMWFGFVADSFGSALPLTWNHEGRIHALYDSRYDLIRAAPEASGGPPLTLAQVFEEEDRRKAARTAAPAGAVIVEDDDGEF